MKSLVLYGDSLFAQADKQRVIIFENALPGYDIYNCATSGWNTDDCLKKAAYMSKLQPDVLVISLGTNDAAPYKQVPIEVFADNIAKIFGYFPNSKIVYFLPTPVDEQKTKLRGAKVITNADIKPYHDKAKEVCEENNVSYIDSFKLFKPLLEAGKEYHIEDGIHFTDYAYELIAQELAKILA